MAESTPERQLEFLRAFTTHEPAIRAFVRRLVPARADADDILQEVAIVLWEKFHEFRPAEDFKAWACGIAKYKVLAWLRDRGRDRLVLRPDVVELIATDSLHREPQLQRQREALEACLEKLPEQERSLLAQAYQSGANMQEVAVVSGRSLGGFYQWLHRVRQLLLGCVQRQLAEEARL